MQKIKFKIEYKPLTDEAINRRKDFDALLSMHAVAVKLNFFQKLLKNKWTMFSGGIIIGTLATLLVMVNKGNDQTDQFNNNKTNTSINNIAENKLSPSVDQTTANGIAISDTSTSVQQAENNALDLNNTLSSQNKLSEENVNGNSLAVANKSNEENSEKASKASQKIIEVKPEINNEMPKEKEIPVGIVTEPADAIYGEATSPVAQNTSTNLLSSLENGTSLTSGAIKTETETDPKIEGSGGDIKNGSIISETENKEIANTEVPTENIAAEKNLDHPEDKTEAGAIKQEQKKINKPVEFTFIDKIFEKDIFNRDTSHVADSTISLKPNKQLPDSADFTDRYAQLSFFTPLGTNGLDSYKYKHHLSINIIQGYNGAVEGIEAGGVANFDKGFVHGGQFAGVGNIVGGNVVGMQGAGVINLTRSISGGQFAGVANVSILGVKGMQGAGVANFTAKKLDGFQAAGVVNLSTSIKDSSNFFQAAGVCNVSLSDNGTGSQVAGVLNIANDIKGGQIGLVNMAKNVDGFQVGLVNIADTINGVSIGLLSFSRNGIFDVNVFTTDILNANVGIRVGSQYIYNIFAFGISPFSNTPRYGYGLGIGGHIPVKNAFSADIDAMAWNIFEDNYDFNYNNFRLLNQLRIMPAYTINKYISVFAGPELNVEVYEDSVVPLKSNTLADFGGGGFTTSLSLGFVAGIRFF